MSATNTSNNVKIEIKEEIESFNSDSCITLPEPSYINKYDNLIDISEPKFKAFNSESDTNEDIVIEIKQESCGGQYGTFTTHETQVILCKEETVNNGSTVSHAETDVDSVTNSYYKIYQAEAKNKVSHLIKKSFTCDYCQHEAHSKNALTKHILSHTTKENVSKTKRKRKPYKCKNCNQTFYLNANFKEHRSKVKSKTSFACEKCNNKFIKQCCRDTHMKVHNGENYQTCLVCDRVLNGFDNLETCASNFDCKICNKHFNAKTNLRVHLITHTSEKPFCCKICNKKFKRISHLKGHLIIHTGVKPFQCDVCNKTFNRGPHLRTHLLRHNGEKPFQCNICNKKFSSKCNLKQHIPSHNMKHQCSMCVRKFNCISTLHIHMKSHLNKKFECNICHKSYSNQRSLSYHLYTHSDSYYFQCDYCSKKTATKSELEKHIRKHTDEKPFKCTMCDRTYKLKNSLRVHVHRAHKKRHVFNAATN